MVSYVHDQTILDNFSFLSSISVNPNLPRILSFLIQSLSVLLRIHLSILISSILTFWLCFLAAQH